MDLLIFGATSISCYYPEQLMKLHCPVTCYLQKVGQMIQQSSESYMQIVVVMLSSRQGTLRSSWSIQLWKKTGLLSLVVLEITCFQTPRALFLEFIRTQALWASALSHTLSWMFLTNLSFLRYSLSEALLH